MTENKRFTLTFDDKIIDNLTGIIHEVHSGYDVAMDLSGLLNTLNYDNEQLKNRLKKTFHEINDYACTIKQLQDKIDVKEVLLKQYEEENEQLKQRISELELLNDGLNYALQNIKKIDVEIDIGDDGYDY